MERLVLEVGGHLGQDSFDSLHDSLVTAYLGHREDLGARPTVEIVMGGLYRS